MQTNLNLNTSQPQFGMAFRRPDNLESFAKYVELPKHSQQKGLKQIIKEQAKNQYVDMVFNPETKAIDVVDGLISESPTQKLIKTFEASDYNTSEIVINDIIKDARKRMDDSGRLKKIGIAFSTARKVAKQIFKEIINPKLSVKSNIYDAGEFATKLNFERRMAQTNKNKGIVIADKLFPEKK